MLLIHFVYKDYFKRLYIVIEEVFNQIVHLLSEMLAWEVKDIIALVALIISAVALVISIKNNNRDYREKHKRIKIRVIDLKLLDFSDNKEKVTIQFKCEIFNPSEKTMSIKLLYTKLGYVESIYDMGIKCDEYDNENYPTWQLMKYFINCLRIKVMGRGKSIFEEQNSWIDIDILNDSEETLLKLMPGTIEEFVYNITITKSEWENFQKDIKSFSIPFLDVEFINVNEKIIMDRVFFLLNEKMEDYLSDFYRYSKDLTLEKWLNGDTIRKKDDREHSQIYFVGTLPIKIGYNLSEILLGIIGLYVMVIHTWWKKRR